ncbi:unnamed protein product [Ixodes hexagonus]
MATRPLRPAPPPPVPNHSAQLQAPPLTQRDTNNNSNERKTDVAPCRPTVIRPKVIETPKKKPPPRPPPPKSGSIFSRGSSQSNSGFVSDSTAADLDSVFGSTAKPDAPARTAPNGTSSSLLSRRAGFVKGQLNLFGSTGKGAKNTPANRKGPAPKQPQIRNSFRNKGAAPAPPVPPHRNNNRMGALDGCPSLISFDSPPASPTCSVASGSSGASSGASWQSTGTGGVGPVSLLDLDVPPLQEIAWNSQAGLPHSRTTHWGRTPSEHEGGAGDANGEDAWNFPRNNSLPSLLAASQQDRDPTPQDPWSFPDTPHGADNEAEVSPTEDWSPPPPLHPPPEPPPEDDGSLPLSGAAVARCDYQASTPGELSFKAHDLIALFSEERPGMFRGRCGNEEGLVPKRCLDILSFPKASSMSGGTAVPPTCRVLYNFEAESAQELSLKQGDLVRHLGAIDDDWALGELGGKRGRFPAAFVEQPQQQPTGCPAVALYSFSTEQDGDLGFCEGDTVTVLSRINKDWLYGEHGGHKGQFPASFVQPISKQTAAKGTSVDIYRAAFPFEAQHSDELTLHPGDNVQVTRKVNRDWWQGRLLGNSAASSAEGIFPAAFVERLS